MNYFFNPTIEEKSDKNYKYSFKVALLGESGVGKTSLIYHYIHHKKNAVPMSQFTEPITVPTIGVEFACQYYTVGDTTIRLYVWDTAGQERFRSIIRSYYRDVFCFVIVYDVTNYNSFRAVDHWIKELRENLAMSENENLNDKYLIVLVGNKTDLTLMPNGRRVTFEEGKRMAKKHGIEHFFETNALGQFVVFDNIHSINIFTEIADIIVKNLDKYISVNANMSTNIENQLAIDSGESNGEVSLCCRS